MKFLEWTATIVTLTGATLTSLGYEPWNVFVLNIGSLLWFTWASFVGKMSIAVVNFGMLLIYMVGSCRRIYGI